MSGNSGTLVMAHMIENEKMCDDVCCDYTTLRARVTATQTAAKSRIKTKRSDLYSGVKENFRTDSDRFSNSRFPESHAGMSDVTGEYDARSARNMGSRRLLRKIAK